MGRSGSQWQRTGAVVKAFFSLLNAADSAMSKCHGVAFWQRLCEGVGDVRIVIDEAVVSIGETEEGLDISDVAGCWPGLDC